MDIDSVVPLDEQSLLDAARRSTGLEDFGDDDWIEPFHVLVESLDNEAELNLIGRLRTRSELLQLLQARLEIEETYKRHPEIEEEEISQPLVVVGQGRSGTSYLLNILAESSANGVLSHWEAMFPCPPPEAENYQSDSRIEKCHKLIDQWNRVTPTLSSMHEFAGHMPMECCQVLALNFRSPTWFSGMGQAASYDAYMATQDYDSTMQYHKRVMKLLQWKNPRQHWVFKDPTHIDRIEALLKVYPDACVIWPHRDPVKALASTVSLIGTLQWGRSDHPFKGHSFEYVVDPFISANRLDNFIKKMESGVIPEKQMFNLLYKDLVEQPLEIIERMYDYFGISFTADDMAAMQRYVKNNPRAARPAHKIQLVDDVTNQRAREAYANYQRYFSVPNE